MKYHEAKQGDVIRFYDSSFQPWSDHLVLDNNGTELTLLRPYIYKHGPKYIHHAQRLVVPYSDTRGIYKVSE